MSRYRADEATIWVWDEYERTYIKWRSSDYWDDIRLILKAYFPQHGALSYNATRRLWSVPLWRRPPFSLEGTSDAVRGRPAAARSRPHSRRCTCFPLRRPSWYRPRTARWRRSIIPTRAVTARR